MPAWRTTSNKTPGWLKLGIMFWTITRCPEDETGKNSVKPWRIPKRTAWIMFTILFYYTEAKNILFTDIRIQFHLKFTAGIHPFTMDIHRSLPWRHQSHQEKKHDYCPKQSLFQKYTPPLFLTILYSEVIRKSYYEYL